MMMEVDNMGFHNPAQQFYDGLAARYDIITTEEDGYDVWTGLYSDLIAQHGASGKRLLDLGCGTGKSAIELMRRGFEVTGADLSTEMLDVARCKDGADAVSFVHADARDLPDLGSFDVITTMGEPFTHLSNEEELARAFAGVARSLVPGGIFVFDLPTAGFNDRLAKWSVIDESENSVVLWRGSPVDEKAHTTNLTIDVFLSSDDKWVRSKETVTHYYFAPEQVERLLQAAGLTMQSARGLYKGELQSDVDLTAHRKYLVVARKY
ncbi:methyltransferase domain-containing protein [Streptomyces sp. NPDC050625]|uniref:class I SAM-dependent DNA methyltransferase n=1 Tax=Streptomyces sp. NPDC050625 TaxID=3154629 RepID=UPI0034461825